MRKLQRTFFAGPGGLDARRFAQWYRREILGRWKSLDLRGVVSIAERVREARDDGRQVFVMGNGGSAAIASHMATDLAKTAAVPGRPLLKCLSLNDNVPFMTAIGNDLGYDQLFSRQMDNIINSGDVAILVSGSGNSPNILEAARLARSRGAITIGLIGFDGGKLKSMVDESVIVRSRQYGVIEDMHMSIGHMVAFYLRQQKES